MKTIALAPNPLKNDAMRLSAEIAEWLESRQARAVATYDIAADLGRPDMGASEEEVVGADVLMVLGGDGTMLRWSRLVAPRGTPMIGVNFGQYGFITEIHPGDVKTALSRILDGDYVISERVMLKADVSRGGVADGVYLALNDVVVSKGPFARMLGLHTYVNGKFIVTYAADGIIISSPTGSTAYSLSAGGPVVHPDVSVLILTPICPHTLSARSLVVPDNEVIEISGECAGGEPEIMLTVDGQAGQRVTCDDVVKISKSEYSAKLIQLEPESFYDKLQRRLRWGERLSGA